MSETTLTARGIAIDIEAEDCVSGRGLYVSDGLAYDLEKIALIVDRNLASEREALRAAEKRAVDAEADRDGWVETCRKAEDENEGLLHALADAVRERNEARAEAERFRYASDKQAVAWKERALKSEEALAASQALAQRLRSLFTQLDSIGMTPQNFDLIHNIRKQMRAALAESAPQAGQAPPQPHGNFLDVCKCPGCPEQVPGCWASGMCYVCVNEDCEHETPAEAPQAAPQDCPCVKAHDPKYECPCECHTEAAPASQPTACQNCAHPIAEHDAIGRCLDCGGSERHAIAAAPASQPADRQDCEPPDACKLALCCDTHPLDSPEPQES